MFGKPRNGRGEARAGVGRGEREFDVDVCSRIDFSSFFRFSLQLPVQIQKRQHNALNRARDLWEYLTVLNDTSMSVSNSSERREKMRREIFERSLPRAMLVVAISSTVLNDASISVLDESERREKVRRDL